MSKTWCESDGQCIGSKRLRRESATAALSCSCMYPYLFKATQYLLTEIPSSIRVYISSAHYGPVLSRQALQRSAGHLQRRGSSIMLSLFLFAFGSGCLNGQPSAICRCPSLAQSWSGISRRGTRLIQGTNDARSHKQLQASNRLPHWHVLRVRRSGLSANTEHLCFADWDSASYRGAFRWIRVACIIFIFNCDEIHGRSKSFSNRYLP